MFNNISSSNIKYEESRLLRLLDGISKFTNEDLRGIVVSERSYLGECTIRRRDAVRKLWSASDGATSAKKKTILMP